METQEQKTVLTPKKKKGKLLIVFLIIAVLLASVYFFFFSGGSSTPSIELVPYKSGDKWGYVDLTGKIVINPQFNSATVFIDGIALVRSADNKYGYIGEDGKYKINPTYKSALPFSEGLACVVPENGKPQFIDEKNNVKFTVNTGEVCGSFNNGLALVKVEDKYGYIDKEGKMKINPQFDIAYPFNEGLATVVISNKKENKDKAALDSLNAQLDAALQNLDNSNNQKVVYSSYQKRENLYGFINKKGEIIINPQFKSAISFSEGLAVVSDGEKYGYIDKNGKYVINPQFDAAGDFKNGMAIISQGSMYGYIDKEGKIIINPQFKYALNFSVDNDIALVWSSDGKAGFIDKEGKYLINPQFEKGTNFYGDIAFVRSADKWGIIDKEGKYIVNPQFDKIDVDFENYKYQTVQSDYFDMAGIIQNFLTGTDKNNFRGINTNTTFSQIANTAGGKDKLINHYNNSVDHYLKEQLSKEVTLNRIYYSFNNLLEQKPIYRTVQKYDYWKGGYYNVQELYDHEYTFNDNAKITSAIYTLIFSGKAYEKKNELMIALGEEIATKLGVKNNNDNTSNYITIKNDEIEITIDKSRGEVTFSNLVLLLLLNKAEQARNDSIAQAAAAAEDARYAR
ncbi:MAG: hypothetical protein A2X08_04185 [Bacteroidetes bacterium GWA2_32_17]|nr:MAG: hypothetical protein A2X08_04185 [Bacteroidetes bacterium GWA2_32_17]